MGAGAADPAEEAVRAYIAGAAYASGEEAIKGSLAPGKLADMVVLSHDILDCPAEAIAEARVEATIVDGRIVYAADDGGLAEAS